MKTKRWKLTGNKKIKKITRLKSLWTTPKAYVQLMEPLVKLRSSNQENFFQHFKKHQAVDTNLAVPFTINWYILSTSAVHSTNWNKHLPQQETLYREHKQTSNPSYYQSALRRVIFTWAYFKRPLSRWLTDTHVPALTVFLLSTSLNNRLNSDKIHLCKRS